MKTPEQSEKVADIADILNGKQRYEITSSSLGQRARVVTDNTTF
jgi:hypothetical protein